MKDKHDLVEDADLKFVDEKEHKRTQQMGEHSATKTKKSNGQEPDKTH